jgi:hypothetical protein
LQVDPDLKSAVAAKQHQDDMEVAALVERGVQPVRLVYEDGGQNPSFSAKVGDVSRPEAIALGPREILLDEKTGKPMVTADAETAAPKKGAKVTLAANAATSRPTAALSVENQTTALAKTPANTMMAVADATGALAPQEDSAKQDQPFYKRWFSNPFAAKSAETATAEMGDTAPQPQNIPLPPRRQPVRANKPSAISPKTAKPPLATSQQEAAKFTAAAQAQTQ